MTVLAGSVLGGRTLPCRPCVHRAPIRGAPLRVQAVSAPPKLSDFDRAEEARLQGTDAFTELVKLNQPKQAVNRPQKVRPHIARGRASYERIATGNLTYLVAQGELNFRQNPTFEDCYPASEKNYKTVLHDGQVLRVRSALPGRPVLWTHDGEGAASGSAMSCNSLVLCLHLTCRLAHGNYSV